MTADPNFIQMAEDGTMLIDCPGFGDSNKYKEFPNMTLVNRIVATAKSVTIALVIKGSSIEASNG